MTTTLPTPDPRTIVIWQDNRSGWYQDAWDGWYPTLGEALADAPGGIGRNPEVLP